MSGDGDFRWVKGKVAKRDKDGNEIDDDRLGSGGARRDDGTLSAMAYDIEPLSDDELSSKGDASSEDAEMRGAYLFMAALEGIGEYVGPVYKELRPELREFWVERGVPKVRRMVKRVISRRRSGPEGATAEVVESAELRDLSPELSRGGIQLTKEELAAGMRAWKTVVAMEKALRDLLANADVDDDDEQLLQMQSAMRTLAPENRAALANHILELEPSFSEDEALRLIVKIFGEGRILDGRYIPVALEPLAEPPSLGRGEY